MRFTKLWKFAAAAALATPMWTAASMAPAHAMDPDATAPCTVAGNVAIAPPVVAEPQYHNFNFVSTSITCPILPGVMDDAGVYNVNAAGGSILPEDCAGGVGEGDFTGGNTGEPAPITGGHFYYARVGVLVVAAGGLNSTGDPGPADNHVFATVLAFVPAANQLCLPKAAGPLLPPPFQGGVTAAALTGVAAIANNPVGGQLPRIGRPLGCLVADWCK